MHAKPIFSLAEFFSSSFRNYLIRFNFRKKSTTMKKQILTVIITLLVILLVFIIYIYSGSYKLSQSSENAVLTKVFTTAKDRSISKRIQGIEIPSLTDTSLFHMGFAHYNEMCATCHGGPGIDPDELAKGLFPAPPKFYKSDDMPESAEAFWVIKHGIEFTSMPAFGPTHDDQEIWAITAFVLNEMNKMSPEEYMDWQRKYAGEDDD